MTACFQETVELVGQAHNAFELFGRGDQIGEQALAGPVITFPCGLAGGNEAYYTFNEWVCCWHSSHRSEGILLLGGFGDSGYCCGV